MLKTGDDQIVSLMELSLQELNGRALGKGSVLAFTHATGLSEYTRRKVRYLLRNRAGTS